MRRRLLTKIIPGMILLAPSILMRLLTSIYPLFKAFYLSFRDYDLSKGTNEFIGLGNYIYAFKDIMTYNSIYFTIIFAVFSTIGTVILGIGVAILLNTNFRLRGFSRTINLVPWAIAPIAGALIFRWLFDHDYGMISNLLPLSIANIFSLASFQGARITVILANIWKNTPFMAIIFLASMQNIPIENYEAAKIDGANQFQLFRYITLQFIKPIMISITILFTMWQLATFDLIYGMTGGGPSYATSVLSHRIYIVAFSGLNFGYASAIGIILFIIIVIVGIIGFTYWRKIEITL